MEAGISRNLGTSVNWGGARLAITHTMTSKNVTSILPLGEVQVVLLSLNSHAKEVMEDKGLSWQTLV
jgi:hypothetical protein